MKEGKLWVVATPLGNLRDLSDRAKDLFASVDGILAEDTRRSQHLMQALSIVPAQMLSFHEHNELERLPGILQRLQKGEQWALISDAGTPLMSDPGYRLVRACRRSGIAVSPIPGPSAPVAALSAAGLPPLPYSLLGFLPRDVIGRKKLFSSFAKCPTTVVFFERADRLLESLQLALAIFGPRELAICREITKVHEEFLLLNLDQIETKLLPLLGEITVLLGPPTDTLRTEESEVFSLLQEMPQKLKSREIVHMLQKKVVGWTCKELYALVEQDKKKNF